LRRGGGRSYSTRRTYSRSTRTTPRNYGGYYYRRPSILEQTWRAVDHNIIRPIDHNIIRPIEHATRKSRREIEDAATTALAVHVSALFGP